MAWDTACQQYSYRSRVLLSAVFVISFLSACVIELIGNDFAGKWSLRNVYVWAATSGGMFLQLSWKSRAEFVFQPNLATDFDSWGHFGSGFLFSKYLHSLPNLLSNPFFLPSLLCHRSTRRTDPPCLFVSEITFDHATFCEIPSRWNCHSENV